MITSSDNLIAYPLKANKALIINGLLLGWVYLISLGWKEAKKDGCDSSEESEKASYAEAQEEEEQKGGDDTKGDYNLSNHLIYTN